jgi:glycosyltransferase involved in cell wall biosynthesis
MKIACVAASVIPSWTANSVQVMKVCQALTQNGESVTLYVPGNSTSTWEELSRHYGITTEFPIKWINYSPALKKLDFVLKSLLIAKELKIDLVYTRLPWAAVLGSLFKMPVILELHDRPVGHMGSRLLKWFTRSKCQKRIVLITHALKRILENENLLAFDPGEVIIAPDGVDLERYKDKFTPSQARMKLGLEDRFTAVYSGGFYEGRGLDTLIILAQKFPHIQFVWVGGKEDIVRMWQKKIANNGIENILLTGFVNNKDIPLYQYAAEVLLMPYGKAISGSSGGNIADVSSPMKMFEYMAAGRAILSSDIPVLREVLTDQNALFYEPENIDDLKKKFSDLLENDTLRRKLSVQSMKDVQQYSWGTRMRRIILHLENN